MSAKSAWTPICDDLLNPSIVAKSWAHLRMTWSRIVSLCATKRIPLSWICVVGYCSAHPHKTCTWSNSKRLAFVWLALRLAQTPSPGLSGRISKVHLRERVPLLCHWMMKLRPCGMHCLTPRARRLWLRILLRLHSKLWMHCVLISQFATVAFWSRNVVRCVSDLSSIQWRRDTANAKR